MSLTQPRIHEFLDFVRHLALVSAEEIKKYYGRDDLHVEQKADRSPVTLADRGAEEIIRHEINKRYPDHGILGEEFGAENETAEFVWVIDPIDGTISFAAGCPLFGTLLCLQQDGQPVIGAIHQPVLSQLLIGSPLGTTCNGRTVQISDTTALSNATLLTTDTAQIERYQSYKRFEALRRSVKTFRTWGDCYGYILVALGGAHIMLDPIMNPWDIQALIPVIRGAGGTITAWDGSSAVGADSCIAAPPSLHTEVLRVLNE